MENQERKVGEGFLEEIRKLSEKAEETRHTGKQLGLGVPDEDEAAAEDHIEASLLKDEQDPEEAHSLYYAIRRTLMNGLPKGPDHKELRQFVYDEKNLYLNRGKEKDNEGVRGSDGRQAFLHHLRVALSIAKQWAKQGGTAFDIYMQYRSLNEDAGYRKSDSSS